MNKFDSIWLDKYNKFIEFIKVNKQVPKVSDKWGNDSIGSWYRNQIDSYRRNTLNSHRLSLLNSIYPCWYNIKSFNKYLLSNNWKSNIKKGETPLDVLFSGEELNTFLNKNIYSVEDLYRVGLESKKIAFCTPSFEYLFPYMKFYEVRMISDMFKNKDFLKLENLKSFLTPDIQKGFHEEIKTGMSKLTCKKYNVIKRFYIDSKIFYGGNQILSNSLGRLRFSDRLKNIYYNKDTSILANYEVFISSLIKDMPEYSLDYFLKNIKPILSSMFIENLGLSLRSINCLLRKGILTVDILLSYNKEDLLGFRNLGEKSVSEILNKVTPIKEVLFKNREIANLYIRKESN